MSPNWSDRVAVEYLNALMDMKKEKEQNSARPVVADVVNVHREEKNEKRNKTNHSEVKHRL